MNHYETVFILTPVLSDAQMKEAVDKFKSVITENAGTIVNEENWGLRKLAYPIQKKQPASTLLLSLMQILLLSRNSKLSSVATSAYSVS
jgi:ribosomal protein S6